MNLLLTILQPKNETLCLVIQFSLLRIKAYKSEWGRKSTCRKQVFHRHTCSCYPFQPMSRDSSKKRASYIVCLGGGGGGKAAFSTTRYLISPTGCISCKCACIIMSVGPRLAEPPLLAGGAGAPPLYDPRTTDAAATTDRSAPRGLGARVGSHA